jgi:hypothetical protein
VDQLAFEFRDASKHRDHQTTMRRRCIRPNLAQRFELCAGLTDLVESVEQVSGRAGQPVEPGYQYDIAFADHSEELLQLRAAHHAGSLLAVHFRGAGPV